MWSPTFPIHCITAEGVQAKLQLERRKFKWYYTTWIHLPLKVSASTKRLFFLDGGWVCAPPHFSMATTWMSIPIAKCEIASF